MPWRSRDGTTQEAKEKYIATTLKAAGVTSTTRARQDEDDEAEKTRQEARATQQVADDKNEKTLQAEAGDTQPETDDEVEKVEVGEQGVKPPESQSQQDRSDRGWEVNYLLDYDSLYSNDQDDHFVENPLASEDRRRLHHSEK